MDGLVEELCVVDPCGVAGRQAGQLGVVEAGGGEAGDGERVAGVVVEQ